VLFDPITPFTPSGNVVAWRSFPRIQRSKYSHRRELVRRTIVRVSKRGLIVNSNDMGNVTPSSDSSDWTEQVSELLMDWHNRVYAAQSAHYAAAQLFRRLNYLVGIPAIVSSSIVGTAIFSGLEKNSPRASLVAGTSILAAVLAGLQTFLRFSERAAHHATAADWFSAIRRDIEEILHLPKEYRGKAKESLDKVRKEMNRAAQDSPELSVRFWTRESRRFGVKERLKIP